MIAVPLTILVVAPLSGRMTDRVGPRWPATFGIGLVAISIVLMAQLQPRSAVSFAVLTLVLYGAGAGFFQAPNNAAVLTAAPADARAMASALLALARLVGQICGVALASTIWSWRQDVYAQDPGMTDPLAAGLRDAFLALALAALGAAVVSSLRRGWKR
ncbi:MAG: MFS transporter [Thermomicrobiales bacterium]